MRDHHVFFSTSCQGKPPQTQVSDKYSDFNLQLTSFLPLAYMNNLIQSHSHQLPGGACTPTKPSTIT